MHHCGVVGDAYSHVEDRTMPNTAHKKKKRLFAATSWQKIYDDFLATLANLNTRRQYGNVLQLFFVYIEQTYGKARTPDKISQSDIEAFLRLPVKSGKRNGQPPMPATHNSYLNALSVFYAYCAQQEIAFRGKMVAALRKESPTTHVKMLAMGDPERDFTDGELEAFFAVIPTETAIGKRDRALFLTLLLTGRRRREIATLRRGDIQQMPFIEGVRVRTGWMYEYLGKRRVTKETAEMPRACIEAIREWHAAVGLDFDTEAADQPLFFGLDWPSRRAHSMCLAQVDIRFKHYAALAHISDDVVVHSLRYEYAWNRYQENGHDIIEVQEAVGWRSIDQALHYIKRRKRKQRGDPMAEKMSARFAHL